MRRKGDKEIKKEFNIFLVLGIIAILFSIFILLFPLMPITPYEEYKEKEVVISKFDHFYGGVRGHLMTISLRKMAKSIISLATIANLNYPNV